MVLRSQAASTPSRRALGLSLEPMEKPKVAVVDSSSQPAICYARLEGVARIVTEATPAAGGVLLPPAE
jgi:dihydroxy-acid dehydratase